MKNKKDDGEIKPRSELNEANQANRVTEVNQAIDVN